MPTFSSPNGRVPLFIPKEHKNHDLVGECFIRDSMGGEATNSIGKCEKYKIFNLRQESLFLLTPSHLPF
jgi:hypothetical protein